MPELQTPSFSSKSKPEEEVSYAFDENLGTFVNMKQLFNQGWFTEEQIPSSSAFPVNRATRPMTESERSDKKGELKTAQLKELKSWLDNSTGNMIKRSDFASKPVTARWVDTFKFKNKELIVKSRLCIRGFQEPVSEDEYKQSPTANRVSHRLVCHVAVQKKLHLASLDVSTAFLKGYSFAELEQQGIARKPCAIRLDQGVWQLLAELNPAFKPAAESPVDFLFLLAKAAYGLRDAPLLWHLKAITVLKSLGYQPMRHDSCTFILVDKDKNLRALLTLHVDDHLMRGTLEVIKTLEKQLTEAFGTPSLDLAVNTFTHFGVKITQAADLAKVIACQAHYLADLTAIELPARCLKTAECPADKVTEYRALVSAIAWLGVTSPIGLTAASLLQGCLPSPKWSDIVLLNSNLAKLHSIYVPLVYQPIQEPYRILNVADSGFANSDKYSQNGFLTMLVSESEERLAGAFCLLDFRSNKSKRVATSTLHAEALAKLFGLESALFLQSYILELKNPGLTALELLRPEEQPGLVRIVSCTDCNDLHDVLMAPAQPSSSNKHLTLYIAAIREFRSIGRIQTFVWLDTRDMPANAMTKLGSDGTVETAEIADFLRTFTWTTKHPLKWGSTWSSET